MVDWQLPAWLMTLLGGGFAALVGYALGLRRMKYERRWQAKYDANQRVFKAIHDIHYWASETYTSNLTLPSVGPEKLSELGRRFEDAKHEMSSFVLVGELLMSERSRDLLDDIQTEIAREEFRFEDDFGDESDYPQRLAEHGGKVAKIIDARLKPLWRAARKDLA